MANKGRNSIYYIFQKKVLNSTTNYQTTYVEMGRDTRTIGNITIQQGLDSVPTVEMTIPLEALPESNLNNYRVLISIYSGGERKYGLACVVDNLKISYANETAELSLSHRMSEMRNWLMPANLAIKNMPLGYCVENVCKLGFPDDYVKEEDVLTQIKYLTYTSAPKGSNDYSGYRLQEGTATNHVQWDWSLASADERIYVNEEVPVVIDMSAEAYNTLLEMAFSSTSKLEALGEIIKNTEKVHFLGTISEHELFYPPINGRFGDGVKIATFDDEACDSSMVISPVSMISDIDDCDPADNSITIIPMLSEPEISIDYDEHFNRAVVFCGDVGDGVLHLTLKQLYDKQFDNDWLNANPDYKALLEKFPIGMYERNVNLKPETAYNDNGTKINNEKVYNDYEMPVVANNDNREYFVTDVEQLAKDNGVVLHTTYNFSDLYPIPDLEYTDDDGNKIELQITDSDRMEITKRAYLRAVRYLRAQRPQEIYQFNAVALPPIDIVGKKVRFLYKKYVSDLDDCNEPVKKLITDIDECFYITQRIIVFDDEMNESSVLTLDRELRPNAVATIAIELSKKGADPIEASALGELYPEFGTHRWTTDMTPLHSLGLTMNAPDTGIPKAP